MEFYWWWILVALGVMYFSGWFVSVIIGLFFNPLDSEEDRKKDFRERLLGVAVVNLALWPYLLPAILERRKLHRDMRTGKRPDWIVLASGEESARKWTLSDGTVFEASVSGGSSSERSHISADYEDQPPTGDVEYRVRMLAPTPSPTTEWAPLKYTPRGPEPNPNDEDAVDDYMASRYEVSVQVPRGKHRVEFRVPNCSGTVEECSALTLIVAELEDYNL